MGDVNPKPLTMKEAAEFWKTKKILPPKDFYNLAEVSRGRAFTVSDLATRDCIDTVYSSIQKAISEGTSYGEWKRSLKTVWDKAGWVSEEGKLLNHRRVNTIFRTNIQTAYQAGRFDQMKRTAANRPYWQYEAVGDKRTRPTHWALHGKIFPSDHEFWDTFYPPNGFNCRCTVITLSERQAKGKTIEKYNPYGTLIEPIDPRTGGKMPARLLMPDRGFEGHPKLDMGDVVSGKEWEMPGLNKEKAEKKKQAEKERLEKEKAEKKKQAEKERLEREKAEKKKQAEKERLEREKAEKKKQAEKERLEREKAEKKKQAEKERLEREKAEKKKQAEKERLEKEKAAKKARLEREKEEQRKEEGKIEKAKSDATPRVNTAKFEKAYDKIVEERGSKVKGFVRIHEMRDALGWSKEDFDRVLEKLAKDLKITLHHGDHTKLTKEQWEKSYFDLKEDTVPFMTISWKGK